MRWLMLGGLALLLSVSAQAQSKQWTQDRLEAVMAAAEDSVGKLLNMNPEQLKFEADFNGKAVCGYVNTIWTRDDQKGAPFVFLIATGETQVLSVWLHANDEHSQQAARASFERNCKTAAGS